MKRINWKAILPHLIAIATFALIAIVYCKPAMEGKVLQQHDVSQWKGMAQQSFEYKKTHGHFPLWTTSMFGGMPTYQIVQDGENPFTIYPIIKVLHLGLPEPAGYFFLACICFYILALVLGANSWVSMFTAIGYAYCTYNPVIIGAGHNTKMMAIGYLPAFIAGLLLIYNKKYIIGTALAALFGALLIGANHAQITYYGLIVAVFMTLAFAIQTIKNKDFKHLGVAAVCAAFAGLVAAGINLVNLKTTNEYAKKTIRGGSQLASDTAKGNLTKDGLSKDYAFSYSMYKTEPLVMLFPRMFGGSSQVLEVAEDKSKAVEALQSMQPQLAQQMQGYMSFYWGGIGGTSGPPYIGAIIGFLALMGFVVLDGKHKWWILAACALTIVMSWGEYFLGFNTWLLNNLPLYNKFRAPSMIMVVPTLLLGIMATLTAQKLLFEENKEALFAKYKKGLFVVGGVFLLALLCYMGLDYKGEADTNLLKQVDGLADAEQKTMIGESARSFINGLKADRKGLFLADIFRTLAFMAIAAASIWAVIKNKLSWYFGLAIIGVFAFIDVMMINTKYLNSDNYQEAEEYANTFNPNAANKQIMQDKGYYRVLDLTNGIQAAFNQGAMTAYFHNAVGGYHAAKLSIFQDLIENQLYKFPQSLNVVNMLNAKYIIQRDNQTGQPYAIPNTEAFGACWFVKNVQFKEKPRELMDGLTGLNLKDTALVYTKDKSLVKFDATIDTASKLSLVKNDNDFVEYSSSSNTNNFAVFSEVYYDAGWKAYIDGKETPIVNTNYVLRGISIPAGNHKITFEFKPDSYYKSAKFGIAASAIAWLLLLVAAYFGFKKKSLV